MIRKILYILLVAITIGSALFYHHKSHTVDKESAISSVFTDVKGIKKISEDFYYLYNTKSTFGKPASLLSISSAEGYSGPVTVGVNYDQNGNILSVKVISQTETPGFFRRVENAKFRDQYIGRNIQQKFELKRLPRGYGRYQKSETVDEINAVTGATISCNAINTAVLKANNQTCSLYFREKFSHSNSKLHIELKEIILILLYVFGFLLTYTRVKFFKRIRPLFHILSIVMIGFIGKGLLSVTHFNNLLMANFPENQLYWYLVIGLFLFSILILGKNIYFAHVCPMGIMQDYLGKIPVKKFKFKQKKYYQYPAIFAALAIVVFAIVSNQPGYFGHEIFSSIFNFDFKSVLFYFAIINLIMSIFIKRFWCRFMCPVGVIARFLQMCRSIFKK